MIQETKLFFRLLTIVLVGASGSVVGADRKRVQQYHPASIWEKYAQEGTLDRKAIAPLFIKDCVRDSTQNAYIPVNNPGLARIATYNVHFWTDSLRKRSYEDILNVITSIDADILMLQEVRLFSTKEAQKIKNDFESIGYMFQVFMPMKNWSKKEGDGFGNMLLSKYRFLQLPIKKVYDVDQNKGEERNFINVVIKLPDNNILSVYGTHLDVWDGSGVIREQEVQELIAAAKKDTNANIVLAADWNAIRDRDYQYQVAGNLVWDLQTDIFMQREGLSLKLKGIPTRALSYIEESGFRDCFTRAGLVGPKYTVWTGTVVDFLFCSPLWSLPISGSYLYFSAASDHLPVIMDIKLNLKANLKAKL